jgi:uncharacterized delta-60 repeat protein
MTETRILKATLTALFLILFSLAANAQIDPTFGSNGVTLAYPGVGAGPFGSFILPDGKIFVVVREGCCGGGSQGQTFFYRFNSDGTPDTTYAPNGFKQISLPFSFITRATARQSDGKIILVGRNATDSFVARFNEDGSLDSSFRSVGYHQLNVRANSSDELLSVVIQPDGKILAAGRADVSPDARLTIVRWLADGTLDPSLGGGGMFIHDFVHFGSTVGEQYLYVNSVGKILIANARETGGGKIRRFNVDGSVDGSFTIVPYVFVDGFLRTISYLQPDDKILVSGVVTKNETLARTHQDVVVFRYNADGTPDTGFGTNGSVSFDITSYFSDEPLAFAMTPDGQIIVTVETDIPLNRGKTSGALLGYARLSSDGTVLGKALGANEVNSLTEPAFTHVLSDGRIVTVFRYSSYLLLTRMIAVPMLSYTFHALPFNFPSAAAGVPAKP